VAGNLVLCNCDAPAFKPQHYCFIGNGWGHQRFIQRGFILSRYLKV
jgi:hypothetical protein